MDSAIPFLNLAQAALDQYDIRDPQVIFLQHNAGVTFRIDALESKRYLLKLHLAVNGEVFSAPDIIDSRMQWLSDLKTQTGIKIQTPLRNQQDRWVSQIQDDTREGSISCTVQEWIEGNPPHGDFTPDQLLCLGRLMAELHGYSSRLPDRESTIPSYDPFWLTANIKALRTAVDLGIHSEPEFTQIERAGNTIRNMLDDLGDDPPVWGPIHADIHHDNVLFDQGEIRIIDFDGLVRAPYIYDLGVTLYHIGYQGPAARQVFLEGYRESRPLLGLQSGWIETCVVWAAIDNLAFQMTIPQQRASLLLKKNMHQLVHELCAKL